MSIANLPTCALGLLVSACLSTASALAAERPAPLRAGETRAVALSLGPQAGLSKSAWSKPVQIRTADAAYIKVHFEHFALPAGVTLEVSDPQRREVYRYSQSDLGRHTVDATLGEDGKTRFGAMSVAGSTAVLRLVGTPTEPWAPHHGVRVSRYDEGFPQPLMGELGEAGLLGGDASSKSICGVKDSRPVACYAGTDATAVARSKPVALILLNGTKWCTAWRVGAGNRVFTNNHCLDSAADVAASEYWFNYQATTCAGTTSGTVTKVAGDQMLKTDQTLDYTLLTVKNAAAISGFGYLSLDVRKPVVGEEMYISGHPATRMKELSVVSDRDGGGRCKIIDADADGYGTDTDAGYYCDTEGGNSGSPVLARSSHKAVALHHFGGNCNLQAPNRGVKMQLIWPQVKSFFGNVVP
ncbi:trypsin-like peptidase domain-containing protein [Lysobacter sp. BMK333-48F3]|uniref:trypsin-like serine peptidase n=1 Tax=Lysobacter sp. BMK333-48F3 TaxID=2867962 RepID=UPI001C8B81D8|nr:serine protease [Lysobacter sp. BMK333-48F3]MBX9400816.1 trypsin-like peptidase domain-containing protein [Lysobacter sp. BMK333-48F3]